MADIRFDNFAAVPNRLVRRLGVCVVLSMLVHAALVTWIRHEPAALNFDYRNPFSFDASIRHETPPLVVPVIAPKSNVNRTTAKPAQDDTQSRRSPAIEPPQQTSQLPDTQSRQPSLSAEPRPRIDLEQARRIAREYGHKDVDSRFNTVETNNGLDGDTDSARAIAKAARPDCRKDHAGTGEGSGHALQGLLAIPSLLWETVTDTGCKW